jgi:hypothetical protein
VRPRRRRPHGHTRFRAFARWPTRAVRLHEWGTRCMGWILCMGHPTVTAEGYEMEVSGLVVTLEALGHGCASSLDPTLRKSAKDGAPELLRLVEGGATRPPRSAVGSTWATRPTRPWVGFMYLPPARRRGRLPCSFWRQFVRFRQLCLADLCCKFLGKGSSFGILHRKVSE